MGKIKNMTKNALAFKKIRHNLKSERDLKKKGFQWNSHFNGYIYTFPIINYDGIPTIECALIIHKQDSEEDGKQNKFELMKYLKIELYDVNNNSYYPAFYQYNKGYKDIIEMANQKIEDELRSLGFLSKLREKDGRRKNTYLSKN